MYEHSAGLEGRITYDSVRRMQERDVVIYISPCCSPGIMKISSAVNNGIGNPAEWIPQQQDIVIVITCPAVVVSILQDRVTRLASDLFHPIKKTYNSRKFQPAIISSLKSTRTNIHYHEYAK